MAVFHSVYGLRLAANMAVPGLSVLTKSDEIADVTIRLKEDGFPLPAAALPSEAFYVSRFKDANGEPVLRASLVAGSSYFQFSYCDGTQVAIERNGREVFADWPEQLTLEDVSPYIVGPVLGIVLRLRGVFSLHASAVSLGNHAIALMGPAGAGKSTTAAAFARFGCRVISDDVVALTQKGSHFEIPPGYPRVNLWAESVQALCGTEDALPLISPGWDKRFMPIDPHNQFEARSLPLGAIYVLDRREPTLVAPIIEEMTGRDAFVALLGNTYMNHLPDQAMRRSEFYVLARLVAQIPIRRVRPPADISALSNLCQAIAADSTDLLAGNTVVAGFPQGPE